MKEQLYFKDEDSECAYPLSSFIEEAKEEGLDSKSPDFCNHWQCGIY